MIQKSAFSFLSQLKKNNNRVWFEKNKPVYLEAKENFDYFITELIGAVSEFDPGIKGLEAKNCVYRIYRDIRFSKDKTPYKTHFSAGLTGGGKNAYVPGYYLHVAPGKSLLAGGIWMPPSPQLNAIRQEIDYNSKEFRKILAAKNFKKYFGKLDEEYKLRTAPKGYAKDHPEIELLKMKSYIVVHNMKDKNVLAQSAVKHFADVFKAMKPLNSFLKRAMD